MSVHRGHETEVYLDGTRGHFCLKREGEKSLKFTDDATLFFFSCASFLLHFLSFNCSLESKIGVWFKSVQVVGSGGEC